MHFYLVSKKEPCTWLSQIVFCKFGFYLTIIFVNKWNIPCLMSLVVWDLWCFHSLKKSHKNTFSHLVLRSPFSCLEISIWHCLCSTVYMSQGIKKIRHYRKCLRFGKLIFSLYVLRSLNFANANNKNLKSGPIISFAKKSSSEFIKYIWNSPVPLT